MSIPSKRTVLITGCSDGGLGSHLSLAFHKAGWRVFATARNLSKLQVVKDADIETLQLDTVSEESIAACVSAVEKLTDGSLDILINNAGRGYSMPVLDIDLAIARDLFELNVLSLIKMTRAFLPLLRKSKSIHGGVRGGMVVNNTTLSSLPVAALPFTGAYSATKAAATSITEVMRLELQPFGIKVVNMMTGGVQSTFFENAPHQPLPEDSLFNVARERVERSISGQDNMSVSADPVEWARKIVATLGKSDPPHWVWSGKWSTIVRFTTLLPIGVMDSMPKSMTGLDFVEKKVKELEGDGGRKTT